LGQPARFRLKVRHYEVDEYGHVNHANYVHYLEAARIEALEALGLSLAEMREQGYLIVAADLSVRYHSPARPAETLDVVTYISEIRGARSVWMQEIREVTSQRLVATAEVTGAFMTVSGRPVRAPATFRERLSALHVPDAQRGAEAGETDSLRDLTSRPVAGRSTGGRGGSDSASHRAGRWCVCRGRGLRHTLRGVVGIR